MALEKVVEKPMGAPLPTHQTTPKTLPKPDYAARTAAFKARIERQQLPASAIEPITVKPSTVANDDARAAFMKRMSRDLDGPEIDPEQSEPKL